MIEVIKRITDKYKIVREKYLRFYIAHKRIPLYFDSYNSKELQDICCTIATRTGMAGDSGCVLVLIEKEV